MRRSHAPSLKRLGVLLADHRLVEEASTSSDRRHDERLAAALAGAAKEWDAIVVDTPPGLGGLAALGRCGRRTQ